MGRRVRFLVLLMPLFCACVAWAGGALAQATSVFTVRDVQVDATSTAATSARDRAHQDGRQAAFRHLLRRLTLKADWPRLPVNEDSARYVAGFTVSDERTSTTRYLAKISFDFKPREIRALLQSRGIPFSETRAKPVVVLPVAVMPGRALLWEPENGWAQAWRNRLLDQALAPMIVPLGDLADVQASAGLNRQAPDWAGVQDLAKRAGARSVLVPIASARRVETGVLLDVRLVELGPGGANEQRLSFQGATEAAAFNTAIESISQAVQEDWKRQMVVAAGSEGSLRALVHFSGLAEWTAIRSRIESTPAIRSVRLVALAADEALVDLRHSGTRQQLAVSLAQSDLALNSLPDGTNEIIAAGGSVPAETAPPQ